MFSACVALQIVLAGVVCQPKVEALPQEYRSSQLGFAIRYPEDWTRNRVVLMCGSGLIGADEDSLRKTHMFPVRLAPREFGLDLGMTVSVCRELDEQGRASANQGLAAGWVPFQVASLPQANKRTETYSSSDVQQHLIPVWNATYRVVQGARLIELSGRCNAYERSKYEPIFDSIARSLTLFEPTEDRRQEGGVKTYRRPRFTFEYPSPWIVTGVPYDDQDAAESDSGVLRGPKDPGVHSFMRYPGQTLSFAPSRDRDGHDQGLEQAVAEVPGPLSLASPRDEVVTSKTPFVTTSGVQGWRVVQRNPEATQKMKKQARKAEAWAKEKGRPVPPVHPSDCTVHYLLPLDERSTMCFGSREVASTNLEETLAQFDSIVRTFKIVHRPGEVVPLAPLSQ